MTLSLRGECVQSANTQQSVARRDYEGDITRIKHGDPLCVVQGVRVSYPHPSLHASSKRRVTPPNKVS